MSCGNYDSRAFEYTPPEPAEVKLLGIPRSAPVLALYVTAREASGQPVLALEVAMPGDLHELEDAYPVG